MRARGAHARRQRCSTAIGTTATRRATSPMREDVATARGSGRPAADVYRDLRAGAESGWDFSLALAGRPADRSRRSTRPTSCRSTSTACCAAWSSAIAGALRDAGDAPCAAELRGARGRARKAAIDRYLWAAGERRYRRLGPGDRRSRPRASTRRRSTRCSSASARRRRRAASRRRSAHELLAPGGLRTTPLAHRPAMGRAQRLGAAAMGRGRRAAALRRGRAGRARSPRAGWPRSSATYAETGKMLEKYDVEEAQARRRRRISAQDGFGWTNGVTSALMERYPDVLGREAPISILPARGRWRGEAVTEGEEPERGSATPPPPTACGGHLPLAGGGLAGARAGARPFLPGGRRTSARGSR